MTLTVTHTIVSSLTFVSYTVCLKYLSSKDYDAAFKQKVIVLIGDYKIELQGINILSAKASIVHREKYSRAPKKGRAPKAGKILLRFHTEASAKGQLISAFKPAEIA